MTDVPTTAPTSEFGSFPTPVPTVDTGSNNSNNGSSNHHIFGWFLFIIIAIPITFFIIYRLYKRYQYQYEQKMLNFRNAQADRVLGDMQMVPNEDLDNELI
jgi:hypothetical protein